MRRRLIAIGVVLVLGILVVTGLYQMQPSRRTEEYVEAHRVAGERLERAEDMVHTLAAEESAAE